MRHFKKLFILFLSTLTLYTNSCLSLDPDSEEDSSSPKKRFHPVETEAEEIKYFLSHGSLTIPDEIGVYILSFLDQYNQFIASGVCKLWHLLVQESNHLPAGRLTRFVQGDRSPLVMETVKENWQYFLNPRNFHFLYIDPLFFAKHHHSLVEFLKANPHAQEFLKSVESESMTLELFKAKIKIGEEHPQIQRELAVLQLLRGLRSDGDPEVGLSGVGLYDEDFSDPVARKVEWCGYFDYPYPWTIQCRIFKDLLSHKSSDEISERAQRTEQFFYTVACKFSSGLPELLSEDFHGLFYDLAGVYFKTGMSDRLFDIVESCFSKFAKHSLPQGFNAYNHLLNYLTGIYSCVSTKQLDLSKFERFMIDVLQRFVLQGSSEEETTPARIEISSNSFKDALAVLMSRFYEEHDLEFVFKFIIRNAPSNLKTWQAFAKCLNIKSIKRATPRDLATLKSAISSFLLNFPEEKNGEIHHTLLQALLEANIQINDEDTNIVLLAEHKHDPVLCPKLLESLVEIYGRNNKGKLAEPILRKPGNLSLWKAYLNGLRKSLKGDLETPSEKLVTRHLSLFLEQFPERKFREDHQAFLKILVGICVKDGRYNDISRILDTYLPGLYKLQFKNLLWVSRAFSKAEEELLNSMVERIDTMISKVDEGEFKDRLRFRFIAKSLKLPFNSTIYDKADQYLKDLIVRIETRATKIHETDYLSDDYTTDDSDFSYGEESSGDESDTSTSSSSSEESEGEEETESGFVPFEKNPEEELEFWLVDLYLYKICIALHKTDESEELMRYLNKLLKPAETSFVSFGCSIKPLLVAIKQVDFENLEISIQTKIRELIEKNLWQKKNFFGTYSGEANCDGYPDLMCSIFQNEEEIDLKYFKSLSDLLNFIGKKPEEGKD